MRHGEPELLGVYLGQTNAELSDTGRACSQSRLMQNRGWDAVVCSPLLRCYETAKWFSDMHKLPLIVMDDIAEYDFGDWDGQPVEAVYEQDNEAAERFYHDPEKNPPSNAEHLTAFIGRVTKARERILALGYDRVLVITHAGVIRCLVADLLGVASTDWIRINIEYSSFTRMKYDCTANEQWPMLVASNLTKIPD